MGFRICWMATQAPRELVLDTLHATETGQASDFPDFDHCLVDLRNGWTIVWAEDETFFSPKKCEALSRSFPLIGVHVNETVMHSSIVSCENGQTAWAVWHEGDEVADHLDASGNPPESFARIAADARAQQASGDDVDYLFDVPLMLASELCGFRHDAFIGEDGSIRELVIAGPAQKERSWLERLMGR